MMSLPFAAVYPAPRVLRRGSRMSFVISVEEIVEAALKLDPQTRRQVLERIAASLQEEEIPEEKAEALWLEEAARRARESCARKRSKKSPPTR